MARDAEGYERDVLVDYRGILKELDTAVRAYQDLEQRTQGGFEVTDLQGLYHSFSTKYKRLSGLHDRLWSFFSEVVNRTDIEQYRRVVAPKLETAPDGWISWRRSEKWSGRWESNPRGRRFRALKT